MHYYMNAKRKGIWYWQFISVFVRDVNCTFQSASTFWSKSIKMLLTKKNVLNVQDFSWHFSIHKMAEKQMKDNNRMEVVILISTKQMLRSNFPSLYNFQKVFGKEISLQDSSTQASSISFTEPTKFLFFYQSICNFWI